MALKVGLQLFSVKQSMEKDPIATIEKVAEAGYKYVEFANHNGLNDYGCGFGVSTDVLNQTLEKYGVKLISINVKPLNLTNIDEIIKYHVAVGSEGLGHVIDFYANKQEVLDKCLLFNKLGEKCRKAGVAFYIHNHFHEFQDMGGKCIFDMICENTDPEFVSFEFDTYWAMRGSVDPVEYIKKLGRRCKQIHQKDYPKEAYDKLEIFPQIGYDARINNESYFSGAIADARGRYFTEIGEGIMDIQKIIDAVNSIGFAKYIILEQDFSDKPEFESITISMKNFKRMRGIE